MAADDLGPGGLPLEDADLASALALAGLSPSYRQLFNISAPGDALTTWKLKSANLAAFGVNPPRLEDIRHFREQVRADANSQFPGVRLVLSGSEISAVDRPGELIRGLVESPAYQAAGRISARESGLASFAVELPGPSPRSPEFFSWPLELVNRTGMVGLDEAAAVRRGLARSARPYQLRTHGTAGMFADIVNVDELDGDFLALRFGEQGELLDPLGARLRFDQLKTQRPLVLFPLKGESPAGRLTKFVYGLSHNLPVDVAAWQATQSSGGLPPIVIAPQTFLESAHLSATLSATIPHLSARLRRFDPRQAFPIDPFDLERFGLGISLPNRPSVGDVLNVLERSAEFRFDHESETGEATVAVERATSELERAGTGFRPPPPPDIPRKAKARRPRPQKLKDRGTDKRYTDVTLFDARNAPLTKRDALLAGESYSLEVAVRARRKGLTKGSKEQPPIEIPKQTSTASIWVVLTDESDGDADFEFDRRFARIEVPPVGDSIDSALFRVRVKRPGSCPTIGRVGIRLYHKLDLIDHIELDLRIEDSAESAAIRRGTPAVTVRFCDRGIEPPNEERKPRALTIAISKGEGESGYRFAFVASKRREGEPELAAVHNIDKDVLNGFLAEFRDILLDAVFGPNLGRLEFSADERADFIAACANLGEKITASIFDYSKGGDLFELFELARDSLDETAIVQIALRDGAENLVIPWQILPTGPDDESPPDAARMWGFRFAIEVKPLRDDVRASSRGKLGDAPLKVNYGRWNFVQEAGHRQALAAIMSGHGYADALASPIVSRDEFLNALHHGGGNLLYLFAHGTSAFPKSPELLGLRAQAKAKIEQIKRRIDHALLPSDADGEWKRFQENFQRSIDEHAESTLILEQSTIDLLGLASKLAKRRSRLTDAPIVILNTCDSAQIWNVGSDSFVKLFLDRGAKAVVGTESAIPVVVTDAFGRFLFEELFNGCPLGEALRRARIRLLDCAANPLGLAYSIYGNADSRLSIQGE